jgi:hypothetical protein
MQNSRRMMTMVSIAILMMIISAQAQSGFQAGMGVMIGVPQNEFADHVNTGGGFGGEFLYAPGAGPFALGAAFNFLNYGSETRREPFSTTIPDVEVDVTTTNSIILGHLMLRAQAKSGPIQPYVDGLLGFDYLFTETKIEDDDWDDDDYDDAIASTTNFDDTAFSYGFGGGCMVRVWQGDINKEEGEPKNMQVLVDMRCHYLRGGEAEYLKKGSIRRENNKVHYDVTKSETDLLLVKIGVSVSF